jgi:hypothetical protein
MRQILLAVVIVAASACVDVPDSVRAQFAPPSAAERTNFRPGRHGTAPPVEDPPAAKAAETAVTGATLGAPDAGGAEATPSSTVVDGGVP